MTKTKEQNLLKKTIEWIDYLIKKQNNLDKSNELFRMSVSDLNDDIIENLEQLKEKIQKEMKEDKND